MMNQMMKIWLCLLGSFENLSSSLSKMEEALSRNLDTTEEKTMTGKMINQNVLNATRRVISRPTVQG